MCLNLNHRGCALLLRCGALLVILAALNGRLHAETFSLTTYYPSPSGVYTDLTVTSGTVLAGNGGQVTIGRAGAAGNLSVNGSATLSGNMAVAGYIRPGTSGVVSTCNNANTGALRYNTDTAKLEVCNGSAWASAGGGGTPKDSITTSHGRPWSGAEFCALICPSCVLTNGNPKFCIRATASGMIQTRILGKWSDTGWVTGFASYPVGLAGFDECAFYGYQYVRYTYSPFEAGPIRESLQIIPNN